MENQNIAKIFYLIAEYLEMEEDVFRTRAYRRAAFAIENTERDILDVYRKEGVKGLKEIPGVGEGIASRIEEYINTNRIMFFEKLKKRVPVYVEKLSSREGMGPKRIKVLYKKLGVRNVKDLEKAAKANKIAPLFGFGEKMEKNILEAIDFLKSNKGRFLLGDIMATANEIYRKLEKLKEVEKIDMVGSLRRRKETIGDVDFLIASKKPEKVMDFFVSLPGIVKVWGKGTTKSSVRLKEGFDVDIRIVDRKSYGAALQYFTGSKEHNIALRKKAILKGLKLNEYGLYKGNKVIAGKEEKDIYDVLGLQWIVPELREDQGEIKAAIDNCLPKIINLSDLRGDLHCHSNWDGGEHSILEMAKKAMDLGYNYLGISDHTKFLKIENGIDEKQLLKQRQEIDQLNKKFKDQKLDFRILQGVETNILNNGTVDIDDEALAKLDFVIAGIHSNMKMNKIEMTERIIKTMKNPNIDIISHPTGRLLQKREEYQIDFEKIAKTAKQFKTVLEINSSPYRLDLNDQHIKMCKEIGVKMVINSDAHHKEQLKLIEFGVFQARRGWAEKKDILNTRKTDDLLGSFKNHGN